VEEEKIYRYILVLMNVDDDSWFVVATRRATGFVGAGNTPLRWTRTRFEPHEAE